jgi:glycosyltransferase involved in cell wall biosynthesis
MKEKFNELGYEFVVIANDLQPDCPYKINFELNIVPNKIGAFQKEILRTDPVGVISFFNLKDLRINYVIHWLKYKKIPFIYWHHGIHLQDPDNFWKKSIFRHFHNIADAILLYSPNEVQFIRPKNHSKVFVANNTLNLNEVPSISGTKTELRKKYEIPFKHVVLFVGRILPAKKLDILVDVFAGSETGDLGLVIVGGGLNGELKQKVDKSDNIKYLNAVYDLIKINEIHKMSDVFCIPGSVGLGINLAMHWKLPCFTLEGKHHPEIWYLEQGKTGYICENTHDLKHKMMDVTHDQALYDNLSENAGKMMEKRGNIENMFNGFKEAVDFVQRN